MTYVHPELAVGVEINITFDVRIALNVLSESGLLWLRKATWSLICFITWVITA